MEINSEDLRSSLDSVGTARAAAADRLVTPWWYHPVLGVLLGGLIVVNELGDALAVVIGTLVFFAGVAFLVSVYRRMTGVWINGFRAGRTTRWAIVMAVTVSLVGIAAISFHDEGDPVWSVWAAGVLIAGLVVVFGILFDRTVRHDLRAGTLTVPQAR